MFCCGLKKRTTADAVPSDQFWFKCESVLYFNPNRQLHLTQLLAHSLQETVLQQSNFSPLKTLGAQCLTAFKDWIYNSVKVIEKICILQRDCLWKYLKRLLISGVKILIETKWIRKILKNSEHLAEWHSLCSIKTANWKSKGEQLVDSQLHCKVLYNSRDYWNVLCKTYEFTNLKFTEQDWSIHWLRHKREIGNLIYNLMSLLMRLKIIQQ